MTEGVAEDLVRQGVLLQVNGGSLLSLVVRFTIPCRVDVSLCFGYYSALSPQAIVKCTT